MKTRYFALAVGIFYLAIGILGFFPGVLTEPVQGPQLAIDQSYGYLFGLFPVNIIHNIVHLALGLWGVLAWRTWSASRMFSRSLAIIFAVLAIMGLIPGLSTVWGLVPLFSHDIWLHAVTAAIAAYFGWAAVPVRRERETTFPR